MEPYSFENFISEIKDLSWHEMIPVCEQRVSQLERGSYGVKGAVRRREQGSTELSEKIKGILFWLRSGSRPAGLSNSDFLRLKVLCENLIAKKQLKPEALTVFDNL